MLVKNYIQQLFRACNGEYKYADMSKNAPQEPILAFLQKQRELERDFREKKSLRGDLRQIGRERERESERERENENGRK